MAFEVVSKEKWRAKPAIGELPSLELPVSYVFCAMHTNTSYCTSDEECRDVVYNTQKIEMYLEDLPDIRYNFFIGNTGKIYEGRGWTKGPDLPARYAQLNSKAIYIALNGPGHAYVIDAESIKKMQDLAEDIVYFGINNGFISTKFLYFSLTKYEEEKGGFN